VIDKVRYFLLFPGDNVNFFDPCCGDRLALKNLVKVPMPLRMRLNLMTSGLSRPRPILTIFLKPAMRMSEQAALLLAIFFSTLPATGILPENLTAKQKKSLFKRRARPLQPEDLLIYI